jgi:nitrous oxide reductase
MTKRSRVARAGRRNFLKGVALTGTAAAVAAATGSALAGTPAETGAKQPAGAKRGYRVTPHIAEYYEKARF